MKRRIRNTFIGIFLVAVMVVAAISPASAAQANAETAEAVPQEPSQELSQDLSLYKSYAKGSTYSGNYGTVINSYLVPQEDGGYMSVQSGESKEKEGKQYVLLVRYYDAEYQLVASKSKVIGLELPKFGAFYATDKYYFVLTGQDNGDQEKEKDVFRIAKYDHNWNWMASTPLADCNTTRPFNAGSARMDASGDYLLVRTCHRMYKTSDGLNHQANMAFQLNMETMEITAKSTGIGNGGGYCSHSFNQFVKTDDDQMIAVDHGDAYPRAVVLTKYNKKLSTGTFGGGSTLGLFGIKGARGNNYTGVMVGGLEISDSSYVVAWSSINQDQNISTRTMNVYVATVGKDLKGLKVTKLSDYPEGGATNAYVPHLVKVSNNEFNVLWQTSTDKDTIFCVKIDGNGDVIPDPNAETESGDTEGDTAGDAAEGGDTAGDTAGDAAESGDTAGGTARDAAENENSLTKQVITPAKIENCNLSECAPIVVSGSSIMIWTTTSGNDTVISSAPSAIYAKTETVTVSGGSSTGGDSSSSGGSSSSSGSYNPVTTTPSNSIEVSADGTVILTESEVKEDGTRVKKTTATKPDGSKKETVVEIAADGTIKRTETETAADGTVKTTETETAADGSSVEKAAETIKNTAGKAVDVTTTTNRDASGKVTAVTQKSVIENAGNNTNATVTVEKDGSGNVTSAKAAVSQVVSGKKASLTGDVLAQLKEAAGQDSVEVTMAIQDASGKTKYNLQADTKDIQPGSNLYIYQYNSKTGECIMVNATKYKVSKNGNVSVSMSKKATYKLVSATEKAKIDKQILSTVAAKKSSASVKKGKSTTFAISDKLNTANVKNITYTTSKASIASVSKSGKIKAKKAGTVTVKAKVTLKNGKTKTIKMKITVK